MEPDRRSIRRLLDSLYTPDGGKDVYPCLISLIDAFKQRYPPRPKSSSFLTERDVVLITYGDTIMQQGQPPLAALDDFLATHVQDIINTIHILPFFPYSSDDGFSVIDYRQVNPTLGTWDHIARIGERFKLMFDVVLNHISAQSAWFAAFQRGDAPYRDYFITAEPDTDLSLVTRPRTHPLLTPFESPQGTRYVWTTFSADQVDLNFANPDVLLEMIDVLLFYIEQGADVIRLDAIAFLMKEIGTTCIHLPQTHAIVQLFRAVVDEAAPGVLLITETNVPHHENLSYFGDGTNEAHLVYQFALPPLIAHTLLSGSARKLGEWVALLKPPSTQTAFFNFTASHDGIGIRPATSILSDEELAMLLNRTVQNGGRVSYKSNPDGSQSPYELNIAYYSLLNAPDADEPQALQVQRFLCSQAIMLALAGMPAIYIHSLIGSQNDVAGMERLGYNRAINREKLDLDELERDLDHPASVRYQVFNGYKRLLQHRVQERAFHPGAKQEVLTLPDGLFGIMRVLPEEAAIFALHNITAKPQPVLLDLRAMGFAGITQALDVLADEVISTANDVLHMMLEPYQIAWLRIDLAECLSGDRYKIKEVNRIAGKALFTKLAVIPGKDKEANSISQSLERTRKTA